MLIRKATMLDVDFWVYGRLTEDDMQELLAMDPRRYIRDVLVKSLDGNTVVLTYKGVVLALGGNVDDSVWFLTTKYTESLNLREKLQFKQAIIEYRNQMLDLYPTLWNHVWVGNKSHIKFLKSIGAIFHDEFIASPVTGELFQLFTITKGD